VYEKRLISMILLIGAVNLSLDFFNQMINSSTRAVQESVKKKKHQKTTQEKNPHLNFLFPPQAT